MTTIFVIYFVATIRGIYQVILCKVGLKVPPNNSLKESNSDEKAYLYIWAFTTSISQTRDPITIDTDGIPFIIDNSATGAICNDRSLFVGQFRTQNVAIETADSVSIKGDL